MSIRDEPFPGSVSMDPIRVLHVDDDPECTATVAEFLERATVPIEPLGATTASDALERLETTEIDCIVSAYALPDTDGLTFLATVRESHEDLPFVFFTGSGSESLASEAIGAGATDYVPKGEGDEQYARLVDRTVNAVETARAHLRRDRQVQAIETAQEGISLIDADGRLAYVNRAYADLYGYDPDEMIGEHWELLYPAEDVRAAHEEIIPAVIDEGDWHGETTGLRADGSTFVESHSLSTTGNGDMICMVQDITDRKERERTLERYETIIDALGDPVYTVDADGRYEFVNDAYAEMTGYEKRELVGEHVSFLLDGASVERGEDCVRSLLSEDTTGCQGTYEITVETSDGESIRCEDHVSLLPLEDGRYRGVAGVVRDITERTRRERELEQYETILDTIPDEVYSLDPEGYFTRVVPPINADVTTTGYAPEELVGEHVSRIMDPDDIAEGEAEIVALLRDDDRKHTSFEMDIITVDGTRVPIENHIAILPPDDDGRFRGTVGVLRDITERKARERELKAQNERLDRFASIVSHDLRNPLNVAQGRLEQARENPDCDGEDLEAVAWAHDRMAVLIENILAIARERDPSPETEPIELATLVEDCWRHVETADATLRIETDAVVRADRARLTQLLENLIRNAVEHGGPEVTLTVGDCTDGDGDGFFVADDGPGIPPAERENVFESGYSSDGGGTGLGLAIVEQTAGVHGWTVTVREGERGGSRFDITGIDLIDR
ncbi:PAS domain S-box protein [Natrinema salsiterrestre]|uniref:histidine kinase n=1 Tax=Natrinema salsiterrestre TaxID=2950540 RepID=A0A9Q4Q0E3_9EURY|nr:PAS domain S-box protein [Natrinema salsiterrestre]MDF9746430.1 PAS domain S-box protein [Natrinema salsiterrestre]